MNSDSYIYTTLNCGFIVATWSSFVVFPVMFYFLMTAFFGPSRRNLSFFSQPRRQIAIMVAMPLRVSDFIPPIFMSLLSYLLIGWNLSFFPVFMFLAGKGRCGKNRDQKKIGGMKSDTRKGIATMIAICRRGWLKKERFLLDGPKNAVIRK